MNIQVIIKRLWHNFRLWKIKAKYCDLDIEMQCTNMTYKQYCEEIKHLENKQNQIELILKSL